MNYSLTITGSQDEMAEVLRKLSDTNTDPTIEPSGAMKADAEDDKAAAKKAKADAKKAKADAKAAKQAKADLMGDEDEVTLDDLKGVIQKYIDRTDDVGTVKAMFERHGAATLSKLKPDKYATVRDEIEAL